MFGVKNIFGFSILVALFSVILLTGEVFLKGFGEKNEEDHLHVSVYDTQEIKKSTLMDLAESIINESREKSLENMPEKGGLGTATGEKEGEKNATLDTESSDLIIDEVVSDRGEKLSSALDIYYNYVPKTFSSGLESDTKEFDGILSGESFEKLIKKITLEFYQDRDDVRGRMKDKTIKIFGPNEMDEDELMAIFIHELSHYIDLYFLERKDGEDISNNFYNLSWYSTIVMNPGLEQKDFVSGYAMSNKYEDFAESLSYYVFHNDDFVIKTLDSQILEKKYNFIKNTIFGGDNFTGTDFSQGNIIKSYYRDITKINFSKKNFLQYVENSL